MADLLTRGFPDRPRKYWTTALARLTARGAPEGCPELGYLLEADGAPVGVLLLIFSQRGDEVRCNISSWYVEPAHRGHAAILAAMATKLKHVTYLNTSPAEHTWPILEAQGYRRYSFGQFAAVPTPFGGWGIKGRSLREADAALADYPLLKAHAEAGCAILLCETPAGPEPFVFVRRTLVRGLLPAMQLVYARDTARFAACAGALGRHFLVRGAPVMLADADAPIAGLAGRFFKGRGARFCKGPATPRQNDLAFTEMVVFGP